MKSIKDNKEYLVAYSSEMIEKALKDTIIGYKVGDVLMGDKAKVENMKSNYFKHLTRNAEYQRDFHLLVESTKSR